MQSCQVPCVLQTAVSTWALHVDSSAHLSCPLPGLPHYADPRDIEFTPSCFYLSLSVLPGPQFTFWDWALSKLVKSRHKIQQVQSRRQWPKVHGHWRAQMSMINQPCWKPESNQPSPSYNIPDLLRELGQGNISKGGGGVELQSTACGMAVNLSGENEEGWCRTGPGMGPMTEIELCLDSCRQDQTLVDAMVCWIYCAMPPTFPQLVWQTPVYLGTALGRP